MTKREKSAAKQAIGNHRGEAEGRLPAAREEAARRAPTFPIVGIGASAGGLKSFEAFFSALPANRDPGMAFVLVQHMAPDHECLLADLIQRYTRMPVSTITDGMVVQPNCIYIIPPGWDLALLNGTLHLFEPSAPRGRRLPIDFFFRSLAQDQRERAIAIVFSGAGSDGTLGVRAIKGEGGMVMAQDLATAELDSMPKSAIDSGLVDFVLPPSEMPARLTSYVRHAFDKLHRFVPGPKGQVENALMKIFILLRNQTNHDFSQYKPSTILRRIERRMAIHQIETIAGYAKYLQQTPAEGEALFHDLLIGVTSFFRDPAAFAALENEVIPRLFADRPPGAVIRVWAPGCSTGEEAYSLAILLQERLEMLEQHYQAQVFATDIDSHAIVTARAGRFPANISADITAARLARFFIVEPGSNTYRIHKQVRDLVVFSEHDVIRDPPFSRMDLISCRNLLIYLDGELQKRLIPLFHYALKPEGFLFLGTSESVGDHGKLFTSLDRKFKLYQRKEDIHPRGRPGLVRIQTSMPLPEERANPFQGKMAALRPSPLREITEKTLLQQVAPAAALVNGQGDILYLHGHTGLFLEPAPGVVGVSNILKMARSGLRRDLGKALREAASTSAAVHCPGLRLKSNGGFTPVNVTICPVVKHLAGMPEMPLYLVILKEAPPLSREPGLPAIGDQALEGGGPLAGRAAGDIESLTRDLLAKEEALKAAEEGLELANEELYFSSEEMQSVNQELQATIEELQSTNEELETSKEELQSTNEELATVNAELQTKVADLSQANNDLKNLLAGTGIATVFLDHGLRVLRFTPAATQIINLIPHDVGRPVVHLVSNLVGYDRLVADAQEVLDTLIPKEVEVQTTTGAWYTMRILPYRTLDNVVEGAVITFVDITDKKHSQEALRKSQILCDKTGRMAKVGGWEIDVATMKLTWTEEVYRIHEVDRSYQPTVSEAIDFYAPISRPIIVQCVQRAIELGEPFDEELEFITARGNHRWVHAIGETHQEHGKTKTVFGVFQDISECRQAEEALRRASELNRLAAVAHDSHDAVTAQDREGRFLAWNPAAERMYGWSESEALSMNSRDLVPEGLRTEALATVRQLSRAGVWKPYRTKRLTKEGTAVEVWVIATALLNEAGEVYAIATIERATDRERDL